MIVCTLNLYGQSKSLLLITGAVISNDNTPLPYTNITIKGTDRGTISDIDGSFSLEVLKMDTIPVVFNYIGSLVSHYNSHKFS